MNCIIYARVSTDKQAEHDLSIPAQLQAMRDHARQRDWTVISEYIEPGASAKTTKRPELQRLLACVRDINEHVDVLLVHKIDRLARNVYDHATIKALLKQRGVKLASVVENIDESVSGQLIENIMASFAEFYSANLSEEVKKGMRQKVLKGGWPHRPPRGYVLLRAAGDRVSVIQIHPKDGPLMKRAFELYASGWYSVRALANSLARDGLVAKNGRPIPQAHLRRLLASSFYAGFVRWHDVESPGTHPAIISRELFDKVQGVILHRYKNPGPNGSVISGFPLRGLAVCASCRGRMTSERHGRWNYYRCSRQTFRRELCAARFCNTDRAHADVERVCRQIKIDRGLAEKIGEAAKVLISKRVTESTLRRSRLAAEKTAVLAAEMRLAEGFTAGEIPSQVYNGEVASLRSRREDLAKLASSAPPTPEQLAESVGRTLQLASSLWDLYEPMNEMRRAALLKNVFTAIVLDHTGVTGFTLRPPFAELMKARTSDLQPGEVATTLLDAA